MSQWTLGVLCPSGHTVDVRVSPNDALQKVLDLACQRRKLDPARHRLRQSNARAALDLSLSVRLANLRNRSQLEMVELSEDELKAAGATGNMTVALQSEAGRAMAEFALTATLQEVVEKLLPADKAPGDQVVMAVILPTNAEVRGKDKLAATTLASLGFSAGGRQLLKLKFLDPDKEKKVKEENAAEGEAHKKVSGEDRSESPPRRAMRLDDGSSMLEKLVGKPAPVTPAPVSSQETPSEEPEKNGQDDAMQVDQAAKKAEGEEEEDMFVDDDAAQPGGAEDDAPAVLHYVSEDNFGLVFHADDLSSSRQRQPRDSFFDVTVDEVKRRQRELHAEAQRLEGGQELSTKAFKEAQKEAAKLDLLNTYVRTIVRVQFPDRFVLQGTFLSGTTVQDVINFVKKFLRRPNQDFTLLTTPPKADLDPKETLLDSNLVPLATVHFGPKEEGKSGEAYLSDEAIAKKSNAKGVVQGTLEAQETVKRHHPTKSP